MLTEFWNAQVVELWPRQKAGALEGRKVHGDVTPREHAKAWYATAKRRGIADLKRQTSGKGTQTFAGKSIIKVMHAVTTYAGNGDIHPSQKALAERAKVSKRTVELVQDWLIENGWLKVTAPAVKGVKGPTVLPVIPKKAQPKEDEEVIDPKIIEARVAEERRKREERKRQERIAAQREDAPAPTPIFKADAPAPLTRAWREASEAVLNDPEAPIGVRQAAEVNLGLRKWSPPAQRRMAV